MSTYMCLIKVDQPIDDNIFDFLIQFVSAEKRERIYRQKVKQNADNMLVGAALTRLLLWKKFHVPPTASIAYGIYGKPFLSDYPNVHFNISHSGAYAVCAVSDRPIGVDVQAIRPYNPDVAKYVCSFNELMQIESSSDPASEFTRIWTRKEAHLKMFGCGLTAESKLAEWPPASKLRTVKYEDAFLSVALF